MGAALSFEHAPHTVTLRSAGAVAYLVTFGSIVGFTSFIYAMARLPVAVVSIYTFVNPLVAVFLGWLFFREPFGVREAVAMLVIFAGIAVVKWSISTRRSPESIPTAEEIGALPE
jgi:drug/metabolite transporter (DMT)-like permease